MRLHGPGPVPYQGSYSAEALGAWAGRIREWSEKVKAVYLYFDNDTAGYAVGDALTLKRLVTS